MKKRIDYVNTSLSRSVLWKYEEYIRATPEEIACGTRLQIRYSGLGRAFEASALLMFALGHPVSEVRYSFVRALEAYETMFRLRGTLPEPLNSAPGGAMDYSMGNSQTAYHVACLALAANCPEVAERVAKKAWDPPGALWIGPGPDSFCTVNDQRLAYAMRKFYEGNHDGALELVNMIGPVRGEPRDVVDQAAMWKGLLEGKAALFLNSLKELLHWHNRKARKGSPADIQFFMCVPGLGLSVLALKQSLVRLEQLPHDDVFFPVDLLSMGT